MLFRRHIPLSSAQLSRVAAATVGMLLASSIALPKMARWLNQPISLPGRIQFLNRLLDADFLTQEWVYQPLLRAALHGFHNPIWHVLIDRTTLAGYEVELLVVGLAFRGHALPLAWQVIDFGCTSAEEQIALWQRVVALIPRSTAVVAHGDSEFGSVAVMRYLRQQGWHFILGQAANTRYRMEGEEEWRLLSQLDVRPRHPVYLEAVEWTESQGYGPVNGFAFYAPHQASPESQRREVRYCTTSLPITHTLRRLGHRRWGIECFFKDYKSAGFELESCALHSFSRRERLLTLLSTVYLWVTCVGRWLCKTGQRHWIDAGLTRHLSIFRIGFDWLVSEFRQGHSWPLVSMLYS